MLQRDQDGRVAVLLATFNGEQYLDTQLETILGQEWQAIDLLVSDDGSSDGTLSVLEAWRDRWTKGTFKIIRGPREGFADNFRHLVLSHDGNADYFAFSDQDDIWLPNKLSRAVGLLTARAGDFAGAYSSRTALIDRNGARLGFSRLFARPPEFRNAIVQSIGGGNTMMLNKSGYLLLRESLSRIGVVSHDWWIYIIVTGAGGLFIYDEQPTVLYRQHDGNLVGENISLASSIERFRQLLRGRFRDWLMMNDTALESCLDLLTPEHRVILRETGQLRCHSLVRRLIAYRRSGVRRQSFTENVALFFAVVLRKL
jgi:glycosyltransferase involved in cell wall biosynthesis